MKFICFVGQSGEKRSYSQACVVWIRPGGVPSDVSKITRHARKLPEKVQSFYKVRQTIYVNINSTDVTGTFFIAIDFVF